MISYYKLPTLFIFIVLIYKNMLEIQSIIFDFKKLKKVFNIMYQKNNENA